MVILIFQDWPTNFTFCKKITLNQDAGSYKWKAVTNELSCEWNVIFNWKINIVKTNKNVGFKGGLNRGQNGYT